MFHIIFTLIFLLTSSNFVMAEDKSDKSSKAVTIDDPNIDPEALQIILNPMTKEELLVEADGWLLLLQQAAEKVAETKLEVLKSNKKIEHHEETEQAKEEAQEKIEGRMKDINKNVDIKEQEKLKEELKEEVKNDLDDEINAVKEELKEDIRNDIKSDITDELKTELENLKDKKVKGDNKGSAKELSNSPEEKKVDTVKEHKEDILAVLSQQRKDRRAIIERFNVVLSEINRKIGLDKDGNELAEVLPYRRYIDTVGGIKLDLSDTKSTWLSVKGYLLSEDGGLKWLINTAIFIAILFVFWILSKILSNAVRKALSMAESNSQILNDFFINSVGRLTMAVGLLVALSAIGISVAPIMAVIGAAGFVVAFALQGTLSNFASGIMIMLYRPFDVNDVVEVAGISGQVQSMTLVSTTLMTPDNKLMVVPNNSIWGDVITNSHYSKERRVDMVFGIGYDDDMKQAEEIMANVLSDHPLVLENPQSVVRVNELADSSVNFICRPWVKTADYWTVYWDITRTVKEQFDAAGISIPYPQTDVHIHQQAQTSITSDSAPETLHQETITDQINEID